MVEHGLPPFPFVIPAKAGIYLLVHGLSRKKQVDSGFRRNDGCGWEAP